MQEWCLTQRGSNPQPPDHQSDAHPTEPLRPAKDCVYRQDKYQQNHFPFISIKTYLVGIQIGFEISCKLSPMETICMKCQILFSGENKKKISICRLLKMPRERLSILGKDSLDEMGKYFFFLFSRKFGSKFQANCLKLFPGKTRNTTNMSSAEFDLRMLNLKISMRK